MNDATMMQGAGSPDGSSPGPLPIISLQRPENKADYATILGIIFALGFIATGIMMSESDASFFDGPSVMIVIFGTMAATSISYTGSELAKAGAIIGKTLFRPVYSPAKLARNLLDIAVVARKHGPLALSSYEPELRKNPHLQKVLQMVIDGFRPEDIERMLAMEIDSLIERHKRSASIARRAAEIAPAMGLIGTLVGLVQMLADLENPETIGPAMAVALITTFYGAILGNIILAPLAVKLEKNSTDEAMFRTLIATAAISIARQENPRRLEMLLNSELPPSEQINYFDPA
jgi:chemotaxis protein MotA